MHILEGGQQFSPSSPEAFQGGGGIRGL